SIDLFELFEPDSAGGALLDREARTDLHRAGHVRLGPTVPKDTYALPGAVTHRFNLAAGIQERLAGPPATLPGRDRIVPDAWADLAAAIDPDSSNARDEGFAHVAPPSRRCVWNLNAPRTY